MIKIVLLFGSWLRMKRNGAHNAKQMIQNANREQVISCLLSKTWKILLN